MSKAIPAIKLTQEKLKEILSYNPEAGIFTWMVSRPQRKKGSAAGTIGHRGYVTITINRHRFFAHRLAWLYVYGYLPENLIDHKDRVCYHNWIKNLREASQSCNMRNTGTPKNNTSGIKGVSWDNKSKKWDPSIQVFGRKKHLGFCDKIEDAVKLRWEAEKEYKFHDCCDDSSSYSYLKLKGLV